MRISVVHLRILMLFVNLALAAGFAVYYVKGLLSPGRSTRSVAVVDAEKFRNVRNVGLQGSDPSPVVSTAAQYMLPPEPREPTPVGGGEEGEEAVEETPEEEPPTEGGPLAEEWEYVWGILDPDQPKNSLVMLRKKDDTGTARSRIGSRAGRRFSTRNRRAAAARRLRRRQAQNPDDLITFQVKDRHYVDEDNGIDIWVHKATAEKLVYSEDQNGLPGRPFYALQRTFTTQYEERGMTESLWELGPEENEEAEEDEEEKEKHFIVRPFEYEDIRERQYEEALEGERPSGKAVTPRRRRVIAPESSGAQADGNVTPARPARPPSTPAGSRASSRSRTAGGRITDPEERRKQMQQFEEAVEELPAEAQQEIKEALVNPPQEGNRSQGN